MIAFKHMMMDCPRCGFSQPKDRYCANCGLDVEHYVAKPRPFIIRLLQSPNFHLTLIGTLIAAVVMFIVYSQRELVSREVGEFLGQPLSSREAADPDDKSLEAAVANTAQNAEPFAARQVSLDTEAPAEVAVDPAPAETEAASAAAAATKDPTKLDVAFWEVPRESLAGWIASGEKLSEQAEGRAYLFKNGARVLDGLRGSGRRLILNRTAPLQNGSQIMLVTPQTTPEQFQFGFFVQVTQLENKDAGIRWESSLVLPQPESSLDPGAAMPAVKAAIEGSLTGGGHLGPAAVILIIFEPAHRRLREDYLTKAGEGPWSIFSSDDFRAGTSDWVAAIQLK
ncbi:MAG: hypothetical protein HC902_09610 [Calothrix sp. SM1_5_4]|nr:hypothetical protein [Calothrix sp. SM1_5_4]